MGHLASFPKCSRLLTSEDYALVFNNVDQRAAGRFFLFLIKQKESNDSMARVGVIAAKKHAKLAVQRNRLKRLIRESFRVKRASISDMDIVILIKQGAAIQSSEILRKELDYLWKKVKPPAPKSGF